MNHIKKREKEREREGWFFFASFEEFIIGSCKGELNVERGAIVSMRDSPPDQGMLIVTEKVCLSKLLIV